MRLLWLLVDVVYPAVVAAILLLALLAHVWMTQVWVFDAR